MNDYCITKWLLDTITIDRRIWKEKSGPLRIAARQGLGQLIELRFELARVRAWQKFQNSDAGAEAEGVRHTFLFLDQRQGQLLRQFARHGNHFFGIAFHDRDELMLAAAFDHGAGQQALEARFERAQPDFDSVRRIQHPQSLQVLNYGQKSGEWPVLCREFGEGQVTRLAVGT